MLDELLIGGEVQETSKKNVLKAIAAQDLLQEVEIRMLHCVITSPPGGNTPRFLWRCRAGLMRFLFWTCAEINSCISTQANFQIHSSSLPWLHSLLIVNAKQAQILLVFKINWEEVHLLQIWNNLSQLEDTTKGILGVGGRAPARLKCSNSVHFSISVHSYSLNLIERRTVTESKS